MRPWQGKDVQYDDSVASQRPIYPDPVNQETAGYLAAQKSVAAHSAAPDGLGEYFNFGFIEGTFIDFINEQVINIQNSIIVDRLKACLNAATIVLEVQPKTSPASTTSEQDHSHHLHPLLQLPKVVMDLEIPINKEGTCRQTGDSSKIFHLEE